MGHRAVKSWWLAVRLAESGDIVRCLRMVVFILLTGPAAVVSFVVLRHWVVPGSLGYPGFGLLLADKYGEVNPEIPNQHFQQFRKPGLLPTNHQCHPAALRKIPPKEFRQVEEFFCIEVGPQSRGVHQYSLPLHRSHHSLDFLPGCCRLGQRDTTFTRKKHAATLFVWNEDVRHDLKL